MQQLEGKKFLLFETCGGVAKQHIALVQGLMLAQITSRIAVPVPQSQSSFKEPEHGASAGVSGEPPSWPFDMEHLRRALATLRVDVVPYPEFQAALPNGTAERVAMKVDVRGPKQADWFLDMSSKASELPGNVPDVLRLDCALFSLDMRDNSKLSELFWSISPALRPATWAANAASEAVRRLQARSRERGSSGQFNGLHLTMGNAWASYCKEWEDPDPWAVPKAMGQQPHDNCLSNTEILTNVLLIEGVSIRQPLFVSGIEVAKVKGSPLFRQLNRTYDILDQSMVLPEYSKVREVESQDVLDFAIMGGANTFIGNSVSSFSALILLQRRRAKRVQAAQRPRGRRRGPEIGSGSSSSSSSPVTALQYNGGGVPLAENLFGGAALPPAELLQDRAPLAASLFCYVDRYPDVYHRFCHNDLSRCRWGMLAEHSRSVGHKEGRVKDCNFSQTAAELPPQWSPEAPLLRKWVFTIAGDSPAYDEMTRVAVLSAKQHTSLTPIGLVTGRLERSSIVAWLKSQGIRLIFHTPAWKKHIFNASTIAVKLGHHLDKSPLYADPHMMLATFLRIDLPKMGFIDEYILYADVDVIFTGDVKIEDFGPALPQYFTMGVEVMPGILDRRNGNAGVMLLSMNGMRRTQKALVQWLFSEENMARGLHFGDFGPADQGALKAFYAERYLIRTWPLFNWKPYWGYTPKAKLVHFHGPKARDYLNFFANASLEKSRHAMYEGILVRCKVEPPDPDGDLEELAGAGCFRYIELWEKWAKSTVAPLLPPPPPPPPSPPPQEASVASSLSTGLGTREPGRAGSTASVRRRGNVTPVPELLAQGGSPAAGPSGEGGDVPMSLTLTCWTTSAEGCAYYDSSLLTGSAILVSVVPLLVLLFRCSRRSRICACLCGPPQVHSPCRVQAQRANAESRK